MRRVWGLAALLGFVLALAVHISTVSGIDVSSRFPSVWLLHFGVLLVFGLFVLVGRGAFVNALKAHEITDHLPGWAVILAAVVFAYALLNGFLCLNLTGDGNAGVIAGQYVLTSHGLALSHVSEQDYHLHRANELRAFSGLWMFFYVIPAVYFFFWKDGLPREARGLGSL